MSVEILTDVDSKAKITLNEIVSGRSIPKHGDLIFLGKCAWIDITI